MNGCDKARVRLGSAASGRPCRLAAAGIAVGVLAMVATGAAAPLAALRVGISNTPPFANRHADGSWSGIGIHLWNRVATQLERSFVLEERDLGGLLRGLQDGSLDVVVGPIAITPDHAEVADFTVPYFATMLAVATRPPAALGWRDTLAIVFSPRLLHVLLVIALTALLLGTLVWLLERRRNPDHFEHHAARGVWSAVWWAAGTLTTVGYGDKTPRSVPGRLVAILGMITGILLASILTATFASEMTLGHMRSLVRSPDDLRRLEVGTVTDSVGERWLGIHGIRSRAYTNIMAALDALERGEIDAVVELDAVLRYEAQTTRAGDLRVQQVVLEPEFLAIALPRGSALREPLDHAMLRTIHADAWTRVLQSYLGSP